MGGGNGFEFTRARTKFWLPLLGAVVALAGAVDAHAQSKKLLASDAEFRSFVVEGTIADAVQIEIGVFDRDGKMVDGTTLFAKEGVFEGAVPLPLGVNVDVRVQAYDVNGKQYAQGAGSASFNDMLAGSTTIYLATTKGVARGGLSIAPFKTQLSSELMSEQTHHYELSGIDAYGKPVPIDPESVTWSIPFPEHTGFVPCKSGGNGIACIEFNVPSRVNPYVTACVKDVTCRQSLSTGNKPLGYKAITAGANHTCALTANNEVFCFGLNDTSQLGRVTTSTCRFFPFNFACDPMPKKLECSAGKACVFVAVDAGLKHTCGIDSQGGVWCWGNNDKGQVGFECGARCLSVLTPTKVFIPSVKGELFPKIAQVSAGEHHTCAVSANGNLFCWGENSLSQSGGTSGHEPHQVMSNSQYLQVAAGNTHSCAVTFGGDLDCWGENDRNQIQPGAYPQDNFPDPTPVRGFHPSLVGAIDRVAVSTAHTCAQAQGTGLVCWGGKKADLIVSQSIATEIDMGYDVNVGEAAACSISNSNINCAFLTNPLIAVVGSPQSLVDVAVGNRHTCAVRSNGEAYCWGAVANWAGQLGDGTTTDHNLPARVLGP